MQFGTKLKDVTASPSGGSGKWIKTFREGETKVRFLQETDDWVVYWEHYNPAGTAFPCTGDKQSCPGCTSDNERMSKASRKTAVNVLVGEYIDVYKLTTKLANRLVSRAERNDGTITDREYTIIRTGSGLDTEYDVEGGAAVSIDVAAYQLNDIPQMLATQFRENFPDEEADRFIAAAEAKQKAKGVHAGEVMAKITPAAAPAPAAGGAVHADGNSYGDKVPPSEPAAQQNAGAQEEQEISIDQLKSMTPDQLRTLCASSGAEVPAELSTQAEIIGWMEKTFA